MSSQAFASAVGVTARAWELFPVSLMKWACAWGCGGLWATRGLSALVALASGGLYAAFFVKRRLAYKVTSAVSQILIAARNR